MTHHTDKRHRAVEETVEGGREKSIDGTGWRRLATIHLAANEGDVRTMGLGILPGNNDMLDYTQERRTPKCSKESGTREIQMHHTHR